ncbi:uncharacterized protein B0I36DRAFT_362362 [Microdochium trichocladiopsis]|uniref:NmrA-like domain-containing protein n=1 Tax=Microdochium trichocladiopsis TaxID=1682393 RepID=A0A9P8YAM1_9PEZI|nr:uncharacterized protein B0I36DRAFT_362362 [Microdochium trichocladiopsis]KAH7033726.1 hypothetical protein B0I36DRAFT_362362 [Microdochium trichocladiopsis]
MTKTLTIIGATGTQGGSVVTALLNNPNYAIRGVTRNINSDKARSLAAQGVEVVQADLDDFESLKLAFKGSHAVFAMTNFFEACLRTGSMPAAMQLEEQQGRNLATAAASTPGLEHYIWSSLPNSSQNTKGKIVVPYMASKNAVDDYIRTQPDLWDKTTLIWFGWHAENIQNPLFRPQPLASFNPPGRDVVHHINVPVETQMAALGSATVNSGLWVRAILQQPAITLPGKAVAAVMDYISFKDIFATYHQSRAEAAGAGKSPGKAHVVEVSDNKYAEMWPAWGEILGISQRYMASLPGQSFSSVHEEIEVLLRRDLDGLDGLVTTQQTFDDMARASAT